MASTLNPSSKEWRPGAFVNHTDEANESVVALQAASAHVTAATGSFVDAMNALNKASLLSKASQDRLETQVRELENERKLLKEERQLIAEEVAALREKQSQHDSKLEKGKSIQQGLEEAVKTFVVDLDVARREKDEVIKEATELRQKQACHDDEMTKAKKNHENHVRKVKEKLAAENSQAIADLKVKLAKEKGEYQRTLDVPKELRQEVQRLKVENKSLKTKADGNKTMSKENVELKGRISQLEEKFREARKELGTCKTQLDKENTKSKHLEARNASLEESYNSVVGKVGEQDKAVAELKEKLLQSQDKTSEVLKLYAKKYIEGEKLKEDVRVLQEERDALEEDRDTKAPLVDVGVQVRKRFLVQESEGSFPAPRIIQLGNDAAHKRYAEADTAIFNLGFWKWDRHGQKFESIYGSDLDGYAADDHNWERFTRAQSTYRANISVFDRELVGKAVRAKELNDWMLLVGMKDGKTNPKWAEAASSFLDEFEKLVEEAVTIIPPWGTNQDGGW